MSSSQKLAVKTQMQKRVFPHLLRHSLATNLLCNGMDLYHIKQQLGHSDIRTTMVYIHSNTTLLKDKYDNCCLRYLPTNKKR